MVGNADVNAFDCEDDSRGLVAEYLSRARDACADGYSDLGVYLYLAAFEEAQSNRATSFDDALSGLKSAWAIVCRNGERSLAEYIFERMEPYLTPGEVEECAGQLQDLTLGKLEEYGLTRDQLEEVANVVSHDLLGLDSHVVKVEHIFNQTLPVHRIPADEPSKRGFSSRVSSLKPEASSFGEAGKDGVEGEDGADVRALDAQNATQSAASQNAGVQGASASQDASSQDASASQDGCASQGSVEPETPADFLAQAAEELGVKFEEQVEPLNYSNLAGYDSTVRIMRDLGIGLKDDAEFGNLVGLLNTRHGLESMPALDTLLFRSPAREDANRFVEATLGELKLPVLHMHMEETLQGMPLLCVTAQADAAPKVNTLRGTFEGGGVLVLEDIDLWSSPLSEANEEAGGFLAMQLSRGAREAVNLIRQAVDNPEVYVLATASASDPIDDFFLEMLEPLSFVDIDYPTPEERVDIWMDIARTHPSVRGVNRADLVRLSANMPRFDIYMATREAIEEAYKLGLMMRRYQPVTRDNLFDKLAAYQPLDSREYHELEEAVIRDFRSDLSHLEDLLADE